MDDNACMDDTASPGMLAPKQRPAEWKCNVHGPLQPGQYWESDKKYSRHRCCQCAMDAGRRWQAKKPWMSTWRRFANKARKFWGLPKQSLLWRGDGQQY